MNLSQATHLGRPLPLWLAASENPDGTVALTVAGELDIATGERLRRRLRELALSGRSTTLDLSGVDFIDCGGLRAILDALHDADDDGCRLEISPDYPPALERLLELIEVCGLAPRLRGLQRVACRA